MTKICYCTTIPLTINAFIRKSAEYIHEHTDWDISFICNSDDAFAASLPDYIHYYPVDMKRGLSPDAFRAIREIKEIFKRERFDLVQYSTPNASLYASIAASSARVPVRLYCQWGMAYAGFSGVKRMILKTMEKTICRKSTWIEPDSRSNMEYAVKEGLYPAKKCSVLWNGSACGVDLGKFDASRKEEYRKVIRSRYGIPDDAFVYVFVGRVKRDKGINELLRAYRDMSEKNLSYFFIVGGNEVDETVDSELYNWSLERKNIFYTGETDTVEQYLAASDCYVLPSYREGFGLSVIEAQAMGVPVIVTDIPGPINGMKNGETGLVVPKQTVRELEEAMLRMYRDSDMRERFGREGIRYVTDNFEQQRFFELLLKDRKRLMNKG
ncbi:MAG: glycosyltransferase [Clostridia bacterium]|nr:glycosyltransferase [Clostridia bacterium]